MSVTFRCEHCHKDVKAPAEAAGRRGKCPFCGQSTYVPVPVSAEDIIPLAEEDQAYERQRQMEIRKLLEQEKSLLKETGDVTREPPLEHREQVSSADIHHFVVNYCLDMSAGNQERAKIHASKLKSFGPVAEEAVEDFLTGRALEPALAKIPQRSLQAFLVQLRDHIRAS